MDTALPQKFPFILDRNLAKANCTENQVCTSCDTVVLGRGLKFVSPFEVFVEFWRWGEELHDGLLLLRPALVEGRLLARLDGPDLRRVFGPGIADLVEQITEVFQKSLKPRLS